MEMEREAAAAEHRLQLAMAAYHGQGPPPQPLGFTTPPVQVPPREFFTIETHHTILK
jgi:hypothetical protein